MYDIFFDLNNMHQTVEMSDEQGELDDEFWMLGECFEFENDAEACSVPHREQSKEPKRYENGCHCIRCGELYPQAEPNQPDGTLICYSCRRFESKQYREIT